MPTLQTVRAIDGLERYNVTRSNAGIYNNVSMTLRIHVSDKDSFLPLPLADLTHAHWTRLLSEPFRDLIKRHPSLALCVGEHRSTAPMFLRLDTIDLAQQIRLVAPRDYPSNGRSDIVKAVLEEEHNLVFQLDDQTRPVWRVTIIPPFSKGSRDQAKDDQGIQDVDSFYLVYTFHHVIADGRSAMALTEQLVQLLNRHVQTLGSLTLPTKLDFVLDLRPTATTDGSTTEDTSITIPPSIESIVDCSPSIRTLIWEASRAILLPASWKKALEPRYWAGQVDSSLDLYANETRLNVVRFSKAETKKVMEAAKTRGTTVQAILTLAALFAAKAVFMTETNDQPAAISPQSTTDTTKEKEEEGLVFSTPVSLRSLLPLCGGPKVDGDAQGNYVSEILHRAIQIRAETEFWQTSAQFRQEVIRATTTLRGLQELLEHFGMIKLLRNKEEGDWERFMVERVNKDQHGRKASIKLSNLGRGWDQEEEEEEEEETVQESRQGPVFSTREALFSQSSGVTASALTMGVATAKGNMSVCTTWQASAFHGREVVDAYARLFKQIVFLAIQPGQLDQELRFSQVFSLLKSQ
ncbi:hypothetical protein BGW38_003698 [Lunasporangiospora selenospora]|uniref:Condensation domain-containing protein n=1 Tax=Lunasporangiospora selenospora TaxID=979761 RepID=A0A9P6FQT6_9FUNG|nr:hypothetical protein BGW38_003698 [Lunasporangiospora selenospora]